MRQQIIQKAKDTTSRELRNDMSFFNSTRGRLVRNKKHEMAERRVDFDVKEPLAVASQATGAKGAEV